MKQHKKKTVWKLEEIQFGIVPVGGLPCLGSFCFITQNICNSHLSYGKKCLEFLAIKKEIQNL